MYFFISRSIYNKIKKNMKMNIDTVIDALVEAENAGIGDTTLNRFFFDLFSKIRQCQRKVRALEETLDQVEEIATVKFNELELAKRKQTFENK